MDENSAKLKVKIGNASRGKPASPKWIESMRIIQASPEFKEKMSKALSGENNPFYGRKHTEETKQKMRKPKSEEQKRKQSIAMTGKKQSAETCRKKSIANRGERNPFFGKTHTVETKAKISAGNMGKTLGEKHPQWGKPAPLNSYGISGWFNSRHFRSTIELRFLLDHQDVNWKSAETFEFRIPFVNKQGRRRTYLPDFFGQKDGQGYLMEIKPHGWRRFGNKDADAKMRAAASFCEVKGWEYVLVEMKGFWKHKVFKMRRDGLLTLEDRYEKQYQEWNK